MNMTGITCPKCGLTSHNPHDIENRYCGNCHAFHGDLIATAPPAKKESKYKYHPAYTEGQSAHQEGERRGRNPYSASGSQVACIAWWDGWDTAWAEAHAKS